MQDPFQARQTQDTLKDLQKDVAAFLRATSPAADDPPRRKRGAQPGNQNARMQVNIKYRFGR